MNVSRDRSYVGMNDFYTNAGGPGAQGFATRQYGINPDRNPYSFKRGEKGRENPNGAPEGNRERVERKGKAKVGEARREAGERRKFIERRRGLILALTCILVFLAVVFVIYKFGFVVRSISAEGSLVYSEEEIITASGLTEGVNLYSFRTSTLVNNITLRCPYIQDVKVERFIPSSVSLTATEDTPKYCADIYGEYKLLSEGLRVLETVDEADIPEGIIKLKLPAVSYAVAGREIRLSDEKREQSIREIIKAVSSSVLAERIGVIDLRDQFDLTVVCDGKHKLLLGENDDIDYKLRVAEKVLEDDMFDTDNKFRLDLTIRGKTGVVMDNQMGLD